LGNDLPGLGVGVSEYSDVADQPKRVANIVQDLVKRGFSHNDIVLLSCRGVGNSIFSELSHVGGVPIRKPTGEYDASGDEILTKGKITFNSVYRYKGQESPAVIMVDVDPRSDHRERNERVLYCGMTRATVRLEMVIQSENPENQRFLEG
jgi:superfamily I DNA and RNA helicase